MITRKNRFTTYKGFYSLAVIVSIALFPFFSAAQNPVEKGFPFITNFSARDYHGGVQNWAVTEDEKGFMYFGNAGYIIQYDGVKWKKIFLHSGLGFGSVRSFSKNKRGTIYYSATADFGYLDTDSLGEVKARSLLNCIPLPLRDFNEVKTVFTTTEDFVYFQSRERIFRLKEDDSGKIIPASLKTWEPKSKFMYAFYVDGVYYVHQQGLGLFKLIKDSLELIPGSEFLGKERMQVMVPYPADKDNNKRYLLGLFYGGLYIYNGKTFTAFHTESDSILKATLYAGILLKDGSYALATAGRGLVIMDTAGKTGQFINRHSGLQDESVYALYPDANGNLWLALDNGIARMQTSSPFTQFTAQSGIKTQVLGMKRFEGTLYLGTTNGPLRFNSRNSTFEHIDEIGTNQCFAFATDHDQLLIPTDGLYALKNKKIRLVQASVGGNTQLSNAFIPTKYPNLLLAGDAISGIAVFQKKASAEWKHAGYFPGTPKQVWFFAEDKEGTIWGGTQNEIVYRLNLVLDKDGNIDLEKSHAEKFGRANGLGAGSGYIVPIRGKVYFPCDSLIYRFSEKEKRFLPDPTFGALSLSSHDEQLTMTEDSAGRVWIAFGKKFMIATPQPDGTYKIDSTSLLPVSDKNIGQIYPERDGIVWFCTTDGLIRYDQRMQKTYGQTFDLFIRHITAGPETINPDIPDSSRKATIPFQQNNLRFEYAAPFFEQEDKTQYQTWMEGFDKGWSDWGNNSYKEYTNLSEGNYRFHVRAKNIYQIISKEAIYSFIVRPPWFRTWWAYTLFALLLLTLVYTLVRYRTYKLRKKQKELEEKIQARTLEVKQQAGELTTVNQISQALVGQADLHDLIKLVGNQLRDLFKANIVYLALLDKKTKIISFPYQYGDNMQPLKLGEGLTSKIILTGRPLLLNKDVHEQASSLGIGRVGLPAASYLGVPIPVGDEVIGVLSIQSTETENRFAEKDERLLTTIAANVGVAIKKARLFEEVKQANADADSARKTAEDANAAKSAFLSTVSHELRTPLTSVLGFAKIIKKRLEEKIFPITDRSDPKTEKTIDQISGNLNVVIAEGERLTNLINDVLDLAKIEAGKMDWNMEAVAVPEIVERAIAATSSLFDQKNLKLERKIENGLPDISGDRDKLIQVVVNLLSNAVKFTPEGTVTCSIFQKNGGIVVGITDTGIGIAPEDHDKVFEQFKQVGDTLTDKPKGTGLGLPICKEIVEHHAGRIWLESELGKGSTFYFILPLMKADEPSIKHMQLDDLLRQLKKRMEQSSPSIKGKNATILVVDDDDGIRSLLKQELSEAGYNIEEAANGKEALSKIRSIRPDLVILDVMMPEMSGFDVAAILKNDPQTMEIPIIILSILQDKTRGFRIGVDRYLTKPIDTTQLFSEIGSLLEQGKSRKKVMVVDEDTLTVRTLTDVLQTKGYQVVESDGKELVEKAIATQPDIIILNSVLSDKHEIVKTLRFEKGLENVLFLIYQ
jgi:signal transduction histidine kinase/DNA-binding response OmpR family regulator